MSNYEFAGQTVLVVDDEPDNVSVISHILRFYGAKVYTARHGIEALGIVDCILPDFILLDLSMPHMDGWEFLKNLRQFKWAETLKVIAVTGHAMYGDREKVLEAGFDGYVAKPVKAARFIEDIKYILANA